MAALNEEELTCIGEYLQDQARRKVTLLQFMLEHAGPVAWAKADYAGPPAAGKWVLEMNRNRDKPAASKAQAAEIIKLLQRGGFCGMEIEFALSDPVWMLFSLREKYGLHSAGVI